MTEKLSLTQKMGLALGSVVVAFGITYAAGNRGPNNLVLHGRVTDEQELYGNIVTGYATGRKGAMGWLERKAADIARPGPPMHLYQMYISRTEYDTKDWFVIHHHNDPTSEIFFLQSEGDLGANIGDSFSAPSEEIGRLSKTFLARSIRYTTLDERGEEKTVQLPVVYKNPGSITFENFAKLNISCAKFSREFEIVVILV